MHVHPEELGPQSIGGAPVANTSALARPDTIAVPASTMLRLFSGPAACEAAASRCSSIASPVTAAWLTRTSNDSTNRQSAGTVSPAATSTMSPGTSSSASIGSTLPPRGTCDCRGSSARRAASVRSTRDSCQNENRPLTPITMASPTGAVAASGNRHAAKNASPAASHRMSEKNEPNSRASRHQAGARGAASTPLRPHACRRRAASELVSPAAELCRLATASSGASR